MKSLHYRRSACLAKCGFSLIELLLALAIASTALLGFAQLQQRNLSAERELIHSLQARLLLDEITAVLSASSHPDAYLTGGGHSLAASNCLSQTCNEREFARYQLVLWACRVAAVSTQCERFGIARSLSARGSLSISKSNSYFLIRIEWQTLSGEQRVVTQKSISL